MSWMKLCTLSITECRALDRCDCIAGGAAGWSMSSSPSTLGGASLLSSLPQCRLLSPTLLVSVLRRPVERIPISAVGFGICVSVGRSVVQAMLTHHTKAKTMAAAR